MSEENTKKENLPATYITAIQVERNNESLPQELVEGSACRAQAEQNQEERQLSRLRVAFYAVVSFALGGYSQWEGEMDKVLGLTENESPGKFANGMADFNPLEELIEGGIPVACGAVAALYVARKFGNQLFKKPLTTQEEGMVMAAGGFVGYVALSVGGYFAHQAINLPDFPTIEIIGNLFGK